MSRISVRL